MHVPDTVSSISRSCSDAIHVRTRRSIRSISKMLSPCSEDVKMRARGTRGNQGAMLVENTRNLRSAPTYLSISAAGPGTHDDARIDSVVPSIAVLFYISISLPSIQLCILT